MRKALHSQSHRVAICNPAIVDCRLKTRGFASAPFDAFANVQL